MRSVVKPIRLRRHEAWAGLLLMVPLLCPVDRVVGAENCLSSFEESGALPVARLPDMDHASERYQRELARLRARHGAVVVCERWVFEDPSGVAEEREIKSSYQGEPAPIGTDILGNPRYRDAMTPGAFEVLTEGSEPPAR